MQHSMKSATDLLFRGGNSHLEKCYIFEGNISLSVGEPESEALGIVGLTCLI